MKIEFKIDKKVSVLFQLKNKHLKIKPFIISPPIENIDFNYIHIKINETFLDIPLVWRQFIIHFNSFRIKFLLKKKRWQLTFRVDKSIKSISIDGNDVLLSENRYFTYYYDNKIKDNLSNLKIYDSYGIALDAISKNNKKIYLRGLAVRSNGLLAENVNLFKGDSAKSITVNTNNAVLERINNFNTPLNIRISATKFKRQNILLNEVSGILEAIKMTPAHYLKNKLFIISDNIGEDEVFLIERLFYKYLKFYPQFISENERVFYNNAFYIIIDDLKNKQTEGDAYGFPLINLPKSNINAICINLHNLKEELIRFFSCI
jgi:hypothetical protein